jgi:hypothetical protein
MYKDIIKRTLTGLILLTMAFHSFGTHPDQSSHIKITESGYPASKNTFFPQSHHLGILAEIPVMFGMSYEYKTSSPISLSLQAGFLTEPNTSVILYTMETLGINPDVVLMIEDAFQSGLVLDAGVRFNYRNHFAEIFLQHFFLVGKDTPKELVENALGVSFFRLPSFPVSGVLPPADLTLRSQLTQPGILYGYRIGLPGNSEIVLTAGISINIYSNSSLSSERWNLSSVNDNLNNYLKGIFTTYAYIPSISLIYQIPLSRER